MARYAIGEKPPLRIAGENLNTVAFLVGPFEDEESGAIYDAPYATAFCVQMWEGEFFVYAVTARHCVEGRVGEQLYLRANVTDARSGELPPRPVTGFDDVPTRTED